VHATQLDPAEIGDLAERGVSIVHCPRANMKLASGTCPVTALLARGANVALGTDGAAGNNRLDLLGELQAAALLAKHAAADATVLPAHEALELATIRGAKAVGLESEIGSLTAGKAADIICIDLTGPGQIPVIDPVSSIVYTASRDNVSDVWIAGDHLVREHALTRLPLAEIEAATARWTEKVRDCL
jgi:5-methylthioadenosine/S-adenosylhomocysteine deaminase